MKNKRQEMNKLLGKTPSGRDRKKESHAKESHARLLCWRHRPKMGKDESDSKL